MEYQSNRQFLFTGGEGFLGSHPIGCHIAQGHYVACLDYFFTGSKQNTDHLWGHPRLEPLRSNMIFPIYLEIGQIYNTAFPASRIHYQRSSLQTTKTGVNGAMNMLGLAKRTRARNPQATTREIYGAPVMHPQEESYWGNVNFMGLRSCYDERKRYSTKVSAQPPVREIVQ